MNKRELTALIAERTGFKKKDVHTTLQATIDCISEVILAGGRDVHGIRFLLYPRARPANKLQRVLERTTTP